MDPPPSAPAAAAAAAAITTSRSDPLPVQDAAKLRLMQDTKLRLMCSYGGRIVPRPNSKNLCYVGGDTRIVAVDRRTTLSSLTTHLTSTLHQNRPFVMKYQIPHHDLDALISVTTDEDLYLMIDEYDRLSSSSSPTTPSSRLRIFLFPSKSDHMEPSLQDSPFDSWFFDALKSTNIMRRKEGYDDPGLGFDSASVETQNEGLTGGGSEVKSNSLPESVVLETSSSFGSTSSSVSSSNLPPIMVHVEDAVVNLPENKVIMRSPDSVTSDHSLASAISQSQTGNVQDPVTHVASNPVELKSNVCNPYSRPQIQETVQVSGYPISPQLAQQQQQQQAMHFVPAGAHYVPHYPAGPLPISSYYPVYHSQLHQQQQQTHYPSNQPYPIYLLPVNQTQTYNLPVQCNLVDIGTNVSSRPPMHPNTALGPPQGGYKEVTAAPPIPESATKVYGTIPATSSLVPGTTSLVHVASNQSLMDFPQMHQGAQPIAISTMENANFYNKPDEDLAYAQIYKSQPPAPLPSQYQTMTQATTLLLSEPLTKVHMEDAEQQI